MGHEPQTRRAGRLGAGSSVAAVVLAALGGATAIGDAVTAAGTGTRGFGGDGGPATAAQLDGPSAMATRPDGGFLIVDTGNHRIRRVGKDGTIVTVAGTGQPGWGGDGGPATAAQLDRPQDVAALADGGFLVADSANQRIRHVAADGTITTVAGSGPVGPRAGALAGDGGPATAARLNNPRGITALLNGDFLIADTDSHRIRRVTRDGVITTIAGRGATGPHAGGHSGNGDDATRARLDAPQDVAIARDGTILIADTGNNRVRRVDRDGLIGAFAGSERAGYGGDSGPALEAQLSAPRAIAPTADGGVLVADSGNDRVRYVSVNGWITTVAGGGATAPLTLYRPGDVALWKDGFLVADSGGHRVLAAPLPLDVTLLTRGLRGSRGSTLRLRYLLSVRATVRVDVRRGRRLVGRIRRNARPGRNFVTLPRWLRAGAYSVRLRARAPDGQVRIARVALVVR